MATETLRPNAAGDSTTLVPSAGNNWDCVEENPHDTDTTYVRSSSSDTNAYLDLYNIGASAIPAGSTIDNFIVYPVVRSTNNTYRAEFRAACKKSGGATQYGGPTDEATTYSSANTYFDFQVDGGMGITQADLANIQIGVEIASGINEATEVVYAGRCTQIYVDITYTEGAAAPVTVAIPTTLLMTGVGI